MLSILVSALVLIVAILLAWAAGPLMGLTGTALILLRILLLVIGAGVAGIILFLYFREKKRDSAAAGLPGGTDLDTILREAERQLATAQRTGPKTLDTLPLLYVLGEANSAKTTTVLKCGLDPELIAGQVYRNQEIAPTSVANVWYTRECVLVEAGEAVRKNPALWSKLIRKTRPKLVRSAMGKQAPVRAAVFCVSAEQFLGASAPDAVMNAARGGNQMLRDLARQMGTGIPVYVIVTKLDRVPSFTEYVRNLSPDEALQPVGMALQRSESGAGLYAEQATKEITTSLDQVIFSLGEFRLELLTRENDAKNLDPVYEFPRELNKLRNALTTFLVELARPSHLNANPYLRGFYFSGVRAQVIEQVVASAAATPPPPADAGATRMFSIEQMRAAAANPAPQMVSQKVAQWCFLPRLFSSAILDDRAALAATSNSGRTHIFRRIALASLSFVLFVWFICLVVSWANNSSLVQSIASAASALPSGSVPAGTLAPTRDLAALDALRQKIVQLEKYQQDGAPLSYRWGLYRGDDLLKPARQIYFDRFRALLLANTQASLLSALGGLPGTPPAGADYSAAYNPLKAYLITTSNPDKSTVEFLSPVLVQYWENGRTPETDDQLRLARQQFDFYAAQLARKNPYSIAADMSVVTHARTYLASFGGFERIYQQMLTAAGKVAHPIDFNRDYPGSGSTVVDARIIPGAFTHDGFDFMHDAILHPDRYFSGEAWVLGNQAPPSLDRASVMQQLTTRYQQDFQSEWRAWLHAAQVIRYHSLGDAAAKLQIVSNPSSPLLALFYTASHNTAVADPQIAKEFQPVQAVVAPQSAEKFVGSGNTNYVNGLLGLQSAVAQVAQDPTAATNPAAVTPILTASASAHTAASQTSQAFNLDPQGHVDQTVLALLQAPINSVDEVVRGRGPQQANAAGAGFCSAFAPLMTKFPFNPNSTVDATPAELSGVLQPGSGALWQFYDTTLKPLMIQEGTTFVAAPNSPMRLNTDFLRFFNRVAGLSALLYPATPGGITFNAHILPSRGIQGVTLQIDQQRISGSDVSHQFTWSPQTSQQSQLIATYATGTLPLLQFSGPWALLHLIDKGHVEQAGNPVRLAYPLEVSNTPIVVNGTPLVVHLEFSGANANYLMPGGLSGIRCVSVVAH
ncbi:MAG TPA: ImcF-related family protein [Acidobacteriaceae bacterium]|nr:ImcF-related family protein [Acidobacteriaceae bacterium]